MQISKYINQGNFSEKLPEINNLLANAERKVTFWGKRVITVSGYEGSISLEEVARRVLRAGGARSEADNLTTTERVAGIELTQKIRKFYEVTDTAITKANWFTRLLNKIREFTFFPYTPRFHAEDGLMEDYFRGYSEDKFVKEFGGEKTTFCYTNSDGLFGPPYRVIARENLIREKLVAQ